MISQLYSRILLNNKSGTEVGLEHEHHISIIKIHYAIPTSDFAAADP